MKGQKEDIQVNDAGTVLLVNRGKKGAAVINVSHSANYVDLPTTLPAGTYRDVAHGKEFKVKNGRLKGALAPYASYILMK